MASERLSAVKGAKVLMVGAGGIGCELLKTLVLSGFENIHIIDMDMIEVSNLNRQFLFRQKHVGQSKAKVAREAVLRFRPHVSIVPYHANIKDPEFNVDFYKQFNVVLNGLDNLDARRHVNRLCLAAGSPLVESGTNGFLGQVTIHVKGKTGCFECEPKSTPKTYPVCTITSTPSKFVHCIVWAKELLFTKLFGDKNQENDLNVRSSDAASSSKDTQDVFEIGCENEDIDQYGRRVYDHVFGYNIQLALCNEETWKNRNRPKPIYYRDIFPDNVTQQNGKLDENCATDDPSSVSAMVSLGFKNPQDIWSLKENSRIFLEALKLFFVKRRKEIGNLIFDKDDQLAVEFVTAAANIRAASFGIPLHSLFEAKGIAGNIVHAVATTNAVIAGLIVIEAIKVLRGDVNSYRTTYCLENPARKMLLMPQEPAEPNKDCYVCSETPLLLEVNTSMTKLRDFVEKIVRAKLGMNFPLIMHGSALLYEVGDDLDEDMVANYASNLDKYLFELPSPITGGTIITVEDLLQELSCHINVKHREEFDEEKEPDAMLLYGWMGAPLGNGEKAVLGNGASTSDTSTAAATDTEMLPDGKKRKLSDISEATRSVAASKSSKIPQEVEDDDDDLIVFDRDPNTYKKSRLH